MLGYQLLLIRHLEILYLAAARKILGKMCYILNYTYQFRSLWIVWTIYNSTRTTHVKLHVAVRIDGIKLIIIVVVYGIDCGYIF